MAIKLVKELFEKDKLTYEDIYRIIVKGDGFGRIYTKHKDSTVYVSHGINYAVVGKGISIEEVTTALDRFLEGDFGNFYEDDEVPAIGREYGMYPSSYGDTTETGAIMVHREFDGLVVYFQFER